MIYNAHDYQSYATTFIEEHPISAILLSCGLGKTVITLTALNNLLFDYFKISRVLIIAPLRVARSTWPSEIDKWDHLKLLKASVVVGDKQERMAALTAKADLYIINRENIPWLIEDSGRPFTYDMVVVDELSSFKNHKAKRFNALMRKRSEIKRIVGLTGTPAANSLMDLWAQFKLLDMGYRLGRFISGYRDTYFVPDKRNGQIIYGYKLRPGAEDQIYKAIEDITISMKATDHLAMPSLISTEVDVQLSESEKASYKKLKEELVLTLGDEQITAGNAASLSNKLLQMANGAVYVEDGDSVVIHDRKLDALEDLIEAANAKGVLVAYWFKHDLSRIEARLQSLKIHFTCIDSDESIRLWNEKKIQVGLIHPASAGHGLNLQNGGSSLIWFGLTWSLELYQQTVARLWRQGQKSETVVIQHLISKGTIDERVIKALKEKAESQDALIEAVKAELGVNKK